MKPHYQTAVAAVAVVFAAAALGVTVTAAETLSSPLLVNEASRRGESSVGVTETEVLLGQSAPLTGPAAEIGRQMKLGANAYFQSVNEQGGVYGRKIRMISLDDGYEPEKAAANTRTLIEQNKVFALIGYVGTASSNAALPIFTDSKVPFLAPLTGASSLRAPFNPNIFNIRASYEDEARSIVNYLVNAASNKRIAVLYQNDAYGESGLDGVRKALRALNLEPVALATVERNSVDVGKATKAIAAANPQTVIMITAYKSSAAFIKAMQVLHVPTQFWNVSFVGSQPLATELGHAGQGVGISQVVPFPWLGAMSATVDHKRLIGEGAVTFNTFEGYLAAKVFVEGLKRAGKNPTRGSFVRALEGAGKIDLGGYPVQFSGSDHNGSKFVDLTVIGLNGKFVH